MASGFTVKDQDGKTYLAYIIPMGPEAGDGMPSAGIKPELTPCYFLEDGGTLFRLDDGVFVRLQTGELLWPV